MYVNGRVMRTKRGVNNMAADQGKADGAKGRSSGVRPNFSASPWTAKTLFSNWPPYRDFPQSADLKGIFPSLPFLALSSRDRGDQTCGTRKQLTNNFGAAGISHSAIFMVH